MKFWEAHIYQSQRGSSCSWVFWLGFNSQAYKLSLNRVEQGPFNPPFVTLSWQMLVGCLSQTHASFPPSARCYQMACFAFAHGSPWAVCISVAAGSPASHSAVPHSPPSSASISPNAFFPFGFGVGIYLQKFIHFLNSARLLVPPPPNFSYAVKSEWCYIDFYFLKVFFKDFRS